jgi:hypothetical protein
VIDVRVREQDVRDVQLSANEVQQLLDFVPGSMNTALRVFSQATT